MTPKTGPEAPLSPEPAQRRRQRRLSAAARSATPWAIRAGFTGLAQWHEERLSTARGAAIDHL
jgi:hypothetical protein